MPHVCGRNSNVHHLIETSMFIVETFTAIYRYINILSTAL